DFRRDLMQHGLTGNNMSRKGQCPLGRRPSPLHYYLFLNNSVRPRWPSGMFSALGPHGSKLETRFHGRSVVYWTCCTLNHM
ncbi:hypothetical protein AVEN_12237-1, partial [Araneus ventricosus]